VAATLTIATGAHKSKVPIQSTRVTVGRGNGSDIQLEDRKLEGAQFAIVRTQAGYALKDLTGGAGTAVNGKAVKQALLKNGDVISLGDTKILFSAGGDGAPPPGAGGATTALKPPTAPIRKPGSTGATPRAAAPGTAAVPAARAARTGTAAVPRSGAIRKATGRITGATARPVPAREAAGARGKHMSRFAAGKRRSALPALLLVGGFFAAAVGLGIWFNTGRGGGDEDPKVLAAQAAQLITESNLARSEGNLERSLELAKQAVERAEQAGAEGQKVKAEAEQNLKEAKASQARVQSAQAKFDALEKSFNGGLPPQERELEDFCKKLGDLRAECKDAPKLFAWYARSEGIFNDVDGRLKKLRAQAKGVVFDEFRTEKIEPLLAEAKFKDAYDLVQAAMASFRETDRDKAKRFMENRFQTAANEEWDKIKRKVKREYQNQKDAEGAVKFLTGLVDQFEHTGAHAQIREAIAGLGENRWP
jgi:hypothetical protein